MSSKPDQTALIINYLSKERLSPYIILANNDIKQAFVLYKENKIVSAKLQSLLAELEVILRNAINNILIEKLGDNWFKTAQLTSKQTQAIDTVKFTLAREGKTATNAHMVSNLNFGFWLYLFNKDFDKTLWRQYLYKIFTNPPKGLSRARVRDELDKFKRLRNRVAHCECILKYSHQQYEQEILQFINWVNPAIADWVKEITS